MKRARRVAAASAVVLLLAAGCGQSGEERAAQARERASAAADLGEASKSTVRYAVGGDTTQASITMQTPTGTSQQSDIDVPLTAKGSGNQFLELTFSSGDFVYLSAQNSKGYGSVTCTITDGKGNLIAENVATGGYAIATCEGQAP